MAKKKKTTAKSSIQSKSKKKSKSNPAAQSEAAEVPFEESLGHLKEIVGTLEAGNLSLGDSLEKFEVGIKHLKKCYRALELAEQKIQLLVNLDENGNLITSDFNDQPSEFLPDESSLTASSAEPDEDSTDKFGEDFYDDTEDIDDVESLF